MIKPTDITWYNSASDGAVSVSHANVSVRYFNGRKYETIQRRTSFHIPAASAVGHDLNWTKVSHYVQVITDQYGFGRKLSYRSNPTRFAPAPVGEIRAMLAMVPGYFQEVPF